MLSLLCYDIALSCSLIVNTFFWQHVLEHGKPHELSAIISKLAGQIVKMSQQKFASNVVEKCLTFGGPAERQLLVNEMLGSTDENEPLQVCVLPPISKVPIRARNMARAHRIGRMRLSDRIKIFYL